jgi:glycosyltransferase involved in cell wall biosynthesis
MKASVVIPLYNEAENVGKLCEELREVAQRDGRIAEVILVDDGSTDATLGECRKACEKDSRFVAVSLRRNFGQTAALSAGFDLAGSEVIVPMDGDLQNDPKDIGRLLDKIEEGCDVVSGWRHPRRDALLTRRIPSWFANALISWITGVKLHDYGCALKAYRRDVIRDTRLYGEMHRFIPCLASSMGIRIAELPVNHRPRRAGRSKYGISRTVRVLLDLINVKFLLSYSTSPMQVFGKMGLLAISLAFVSLGVTIWMKVARGIDMTGNPLLMLAVLLVLIGIQVICMGLFSEIQIRTYYETQRKPTYAIREIFPPRDAAAKHSS